MNKAEHEAFALRSKSHRWLPTDLFGKPNFLHCAFLVIFSAACLTLTLTHSRADQPKDELLEAMISLGLSYKAQGRLDDAEKIYKAVLERVGDSNPEFAATTWNNLGRVYQEQGAGVLFEQGPDNKWLQDSEQAYRRAVSIYSELKYPAGRATTLGNLGQLMMLRLHLDEADKTLREALAIYDRELGGKDPGIFGVLIPLSDLLLMKGQYGESEVVARRGIAILEGEYGESHPGLIWLYENVSKAESELKNDEASYAAAKRGSEILIERAQRATLPKFAAEETGGEFTSGYIQHIRSALQLARSKPDRKQALLDESFQIAQRYVTTKAASAVLQRAAREAADSKELAALVRRQQELILQVANLDQDRISEIVKEGARPGADNETTTQKQLAAIKAQINDLDRTIANRFPKYSDLSGQNVVSIQDTRTLLSGNEALVLIADDFLWVVTHSDARWIELKLAGSSLESEVAALRCGLDYDGAAFSRDGRCSDLLKVSYTALDHAIGKPLPFDLARSYALYKALFGEIEDLIKDKQLLIVPSGPLTQLPFQILVTKPPDTALPVSAAGYRDVAWLVHKHAITVLPAVSSLKAVRELAKKSRASEKYIGFGNPLLDGDLDHAPDEETKTKRLANAKLARDARCEPIQALQIAASADQIEGGGRITRGPNGLVDIVDLRKWVPLPETAEEVCGVANILGVDTRTHVYIGADAREKTVKRLSDEGQLAKYKIVHFATHGTLAGQLSPSAEPGLILTPPDKASEVDDGYLSASEVAALKLDADWVILSACNTAAGDAKSAEALSGLARAFIFAGSRSLLVSHWYVASKTAVPLITTTITMLAVDPNMGRAEALRRSMLFMITAGKDYEAQPAFWAPFVLVGEGGAAR